MRFSIITPSFNQAQFLPHNIDTVSSQVGVDLEHIIVDPGSTDGSTEIAHSASHATLIAEPDRGQSHGITNGFERSTGDVITWLNSDDMYPSDDTLLKVQNAFEANPHADIVYGNVNFVDNEGKFLRKGFINKDADRLLESFHHQVGIVQPGVFMRRKVFEEVGGPSESYSYCMDYEYWVRIASAGFKWVHVNEVFAHHRWWLGMKTASGRDDSLIEHFKVCAQYFGYIHWKWLDRYAEFRATDADGVVTHAEQVDLEKKRYFEKEVISRFVNQNMISMLESSDLSEHKETLNYIRRRAGADLRYFFDGSEIEIAKSTHPDPNAERRPAWCIFNTTSNSGAKYKTYRVPDNFERHFSQDWFERQSARAAAQMRSLSERRKEHCIIVGNGPSLNQTDLSLLEHADVMISNFAVISEALCRHASYLTVVNDLVATQGTVDFNRVAIPKIMPFWLSNSVNPTAETIFLPATVTPEFCTSADGLFSWRSTVTFFNMQVAFALGYERVSLIGVDNSYVQAVGLKEGDSIDQQGEDANHFDPRYFQGKTWQAADTGNMEAMYLVAREAYGAAGREIVNSTVGGKLEVFPRVPLNEFLGRQNSGSTLPSKHASPSVSTHPRLLLLDMTAMGNGTATGDLKSSLLDGWPDDSVLQVASLGKDKLGLVRLRSAGSVMSPDNTVVISRAIDEFGPDVILYRPVPNVPWLHDFAMSTISRLGKPLVSWVMDDWPSELEQNDPVQWAHLGSDFRDILTRSSARLSICDAMSTTFEGRYGCKFFALANGVLPQDWPAPRDHKAGRLKLRYAGGLAKNMTLDSVLRVARAVETVAGKGLAVSFEINTQPWWHKESSGLFEKFEHTTVETKTRPGPEYRAWLHDADVSVIAYNFDETTRRYVQYSMANKMPECLASGSVVLAHGPRGLATIDYLHDSGAAVVVSENSDSALVATLLKLHDDPGHRNAISSRGRRLAFSRHDRSKIEEELRDILARAAAVSPIDSKRTMSRPSISEPDEFLVRLARRIEMPGTVDRDEAELFLRTFSTMLLLEPTAALANAQRGATFAIAIERALAELSSTDELRLHFESVSLAAGIDVPEMTAALGRAN